MSHQFKVRSKMYFVLFFVKVNPVELSEKLHSLSFVYFLISKLLNMPIFTCCVIFRSFQWLKYEIDSSLDILCAINSFFFISEKRSIRLKKVMGMMAWQSKTHSMTIA